MCSLAVQPVNRELNTSIMKSKKKKKNIYSRDMDVQSGNHSSSFYDSKIRNLLEQARQCEGMTKDEQKEE